MPGPTFRLAVVLATTSATLLAVPSARGEVAGGTAATIEIQRLRPGLHLLSGAGCNVVAWTGADGAVLVDSGKVEAAPQLLESVARIAPRGVRFVVNTHWHPDHTGGNALLGQSGALAVSQENVLLRMAEPQDFGEYALEVPAAAAEALPVVTFDDISELVAAQRTSAWGDVARRIAHEIKNPLTPIQLSAQRLRKRYLDKLGEEGEVFDVCTRTIVNQVDELKRLVSEFSNFARMPAVQKSMNSLPEMAQEAMVLFREGGENIFIPNLDRIRHSSFVDKS